MSGVRVPLRPFAGSLGILRSDRGKYMAAIIAPALAGRRMTPEEFEALPEGPPYYEYINGEAIEMNKPTRRHQRIELRLGGLLDSHPASNSLGEVSQQVDVGLPT